MSAKARLQVIFHPENSGTFKPAFTLYAGGVEVSGAISLHAQQGSDIVGFSAYCEVVDSVEQLERPA